MPKPNRAFQSPGVQSFGEVVVALAVVVAISPSCPGFSAPDHAACSRPESAASTSVVVETQPKIPPWAAIMRRPTSWNSGK